jgi:hypothetical protein
MRINALINQLELAYSPLSNYAFQILKKEPIIREILKESSLYIITQRPVITFENLRVDEESARIIFEIRQKQNPNILEVEVPLFQKYLATDPANRIELQLSSPDKNNDLSKTPFFNLSGFKILEAGEFVVWFSPEKFLHNYWDGYIDANIKGPMRDFTSYKVLYIGKATEQEVWKRLTGHSSLQEILSLEDPITYGDLPTNEIAILFFKFKENLSLKSFGEESTSEELTQAFLQQDLPDTKTIFLDAEKAFISAMQPKYNREFYKNYPQTQDGLHKHNLTSYSYSLVDPISLVYNNGSIEGSSTPWGGDTILITENQRVQIIKQSGQPPENESM